MPCSLVCSVRLTAESGSKQSQVRSAWSSGVRRQMPSFATHGEHIESRRGCESESTAHLRTVERVAVAGRGPADWRSAEPAGTGGTQPANQRASGHDFRARRARIRARPDPGRIVGGGRCGHGHRACAAEARRRSSAARLDAARPGGSARGLRGRRPCLGAKQRMEAIGIAARELNRSPGRSNGIMAQRSWPSPIALPRDGVFRRAHSGRLLDWRLRRLRRETVA